MLAEDRNVADAQKPSRSTGGLFSTTHWSLVVAAGDSRQPEARQALAALCESYWTPVYALIRCHGHRADEARDLTQGFFLKILEQRSFKVASPDRGKFRAFLRTVLRNYLADERLRTVTQKKGGDAPKIQLDFSETEASLAVDLARVQDPEKAFEIRWARTLLARALDRLRAELEGSADARRWKRLEPLLTGDANPGTYKEIARDLAMTESAVKVAVHRLRKRYGEALRAEVAQTVSSEKEVDDEVRYLLRVVDS
jgi:RNA polymerase sigma-70 factor (ECF subfamily)